MECARRDCSAPAAREVRWLQPEGQSHAGETVAVNLCELHADEAESKLCGVDGCIRYAEWVIENGGNEAQFCDEHCEQLKAAPTWTVDGVTMIHDGSLNVRALPRSVGRG